MKAIVNAMLRDEQIRVSIGDDVVKLDKNEAPVKAEHIRYTPDQFFRFDEPDTVADKIDEELKRL